MNFPNATTRQPAKKLGELLSYWRDLRGTSQMTLSLDSGVSQRHISFIESGRSVPSRQILMDLAQTLSIPLRERNTLLLAAGYAPMYSEDPWDAQEMQIVTKAVSRILRQHDPYPAVVMDRYWNVLMTNDSTQRFFRRFIDLAERKGPRNILHLMFDPHGMRPFIANWEDVASSLIQRIHREALGRVIDDKTHDLLEALLAYPEVDARWTYKSHTVAASASPVIPIGFVEDGKVLRYFSMVTTVGTPQNVATEELRVECMFPADEATEIWHASTFNTPHEPRTSATK
jgi:transcriptional regulator with XRE-family HTH domain